MRYFDHDVTANADMKIFALRKNYGGAAVDAYWTMLEMIYEAEEPLRVGGSWFTTDVIAAKLFVSSDNLNSWINGCILYGLFDVIDQFDDGSILIASERATSNIDEYHAKAEKCRASAKKRWSSSERNANAMQTHSERNANAMQDYSSRNANKRKEKKRKECIATQSNATPTPCESGAVDGADVAGDVPHCAACDAVAVFKPDKMCFVCPNCGSLHATDEVVFK